MSNFQTKMEKKSCESIFSKEGKNIPDEATGTDWTIEIWGMDLDLEKDHPEMFPIPCPGKQIRLNGYAISNTPEIPD